MRTLRVVSRLFCALLICLGILSCANPLPEELSDDEEESTDTTYVVDSDIKGGGWKDTVYWNFGFGSRKMK